jgi:phosphopantothenoylcysteine decarboxylase
VTERAKHFVPASLEVTDDAEEWKWSERGDPVLHVELVKWADVLVIAPLDALTLAKVAR